MRTIKMLCFYSGVMDLATIAPILLAVTMVVVSVCLHVKFPNKHWLSVALTCLIFILPIPIIVYGIDPYYLKVVSASGEEAEKSIVAVFLVSFSAISALLVKAWVRYRA